MSDFLMNYVDVEDSYLEHHGVKGQKWGIRRYQKPKGSSKRSSAKNRDLGKHKLGTHAKRVAAQVIGGIIGAKAASILAYKLTENSNLLPSQRKNIEKGAAVTAALLGSELGKIAFDADLAVKYKTQSNSKWQ